MDSVEAVEKILNYSFENKSLLKEALTHNSSSCMNPSSFKQLEFLGDSVLGLAVTSYIYLAYPEVQALDLRELLSANVCNERFARVAVKHGLYQFLIHDDPFPWLHEKIKEFSEAVGKEDGPVLYGGTGGFVKAPKVLANIVESVAGAVYIDVNYDVQRLWEICRGLLEPIVTLDDLRQQSEPALKLIRMGVKHGKRIDFRCCKGDDQSTTAKVYLDDKYIASGHAKHKSLAKMVAAKEALLKLSSECVPIEKVNDEDSLDIEIEDAKGKLFEICSTEKAQRQTGSSLPTASENPLTYEMTPTKMVNDEDSLHAEPDDAKGKLFEICSTEKLQLQTGSSSLPTASENPLTYEMTPTKMVINEDSLQAESKDAKRKLFESTEKLQIQTGSSSLATVSENPLTEEMTPKQMVVDKDSLQVCSTRKLLIQTGSSSLPTVSENPLTYEMTQKQMVFDEDSLEVEPVAAKSKLFGIFSKKKWPKPIFSVEEIGLTHEKRYVCSVKIEIPTVEGTFHMKGDEKLRKKEAENSAAYHMMRALKSSLMSLVIRNLQMQETSKEKKNMQVQKKNLQVQKSSEGKRKRKRVKMISSICPHIEMDPCVEAVEKILKYSFANKSLLKEALTHTSINTSSPSFGRLRRLGKAALSLAFTTYLCIAYPKLKTNELTMLRDTNTSKDKFGRAAVNKGLYQFFIHHEKGSDEKVKMFSEALGKEDDPVPFSVFAKAPKILAAFVETVTAAVCIDVKFDVRRLWEICRGFLEPIFTLDDLRPLFTLFRLGKKQGKGVYFGYCKGDDDKGIIGQVYLNGDLIASGEPNKCSDFAKLAAAKAALGKLSENMPIEMVIDEDNNPDVEIEDAKDKLIEMCNKRKCPDPIYSVEKGGDSFVSAATIETPTEEITLSIKRDKKKRRKKAEKSSASPHEKSLEVQH